MDSTEIESLSEPDKWRVVYEIWATEGNQNDRETAEITGVPRSSINYHRNKEGWSRRFREEQLGLSNADVDVARIRWKRFLVDGMARMEHIVYRKVVRTDPFGHAILDESGLPEMIYASKDSDAVSAYRNIMETVTNRDMGSMTETYEGTITGVGPGETIEDPALMAVKILEEYQQGVNTRPMASARRGRKV